MSIDRTAFSAALLALTLPVLPPVEAGEVLNGVKAREQPRCGVSEDTPGFSARDADGRWRGPKVFSHPLSRREGFHVIRRLCR